VLSTVAFKFNLRCYTEGTEIGPVANWSAHVADVVHCNVVGRGLHSFTFQLNLSRV